MFRSYLYKQIALVIFLGLSFTSVAKGGEDPDDDAQSKTITRKANFSLRVIGEDGTQSVRLEAVYQVESGDYTLTFKGTDHTRDSELKFIDPVNMVYFRKEFNSGFNKALGLSGTDVKALEEQSVISVFYWMYAMKGDKDEDQPKSGDLHFRHNVMVFEDGREADDFDSKEREMLLDIVEDTTTFYKNKINVASSALMRLIDRNVINIRGSSLSEPDKTSDTTTLQRWEKDFPNIGFSGITTANIASLKSHTVAAVATSLDSISTLFDEYKNAVGLLSRKSIALHKDHVFAIHNITIKIERGFIEDIHVSVDNGRGGYDQYDNIVPIGMSSIYNLKSYGSMRLFIRKNNRNNCIYLSDVLGEYDLWEELLTRDYSPGDTVLNSLDPNKYPYVTLRREKLVHLFDSRIYTDLAGLDDRSPNGLVQVEVSRRFNFLTNRKQNGKFRGDVGLINYIYVYGTLSKIENKLKRLPLQNAYLVDNNTIISPNYVSNLNLRRYENASLGLDVNGLLLNWKDGKFIAYVDLGVRYGHTAIVDSVRRLDASGQLQYPALNENIYFDGHTVTFMFPRIKIEHLSERRVGFSVSYQYNYTMLFSNNRFKQIASEEKSNIYSLATERQAHKSHQVDFDLRILTSRRDDDHIFFRARFFIQQGDASSFFPQFQLGYNYNLIFRK